MRRFLAWANLANITKAADLVTKLVAIVAILAVLNFFKGRGDLIPVAYCWAPVALDHPQVLARNLRLTLAEAEIPAAAIKDSARQVAEPLNSTESSMRISCSSDIEAIETLRSERSLSARERKERIALLRRTYPDSGEGLVHYVPNIAVVVAGSPSLDLKKVQRTLDYIEKRRTVAIFVKVTNVGQANALDVTIPAPQGFSMINYHPSAGEVPPQPDFQKLAEPVEAEDQRIVYQDHPAVDLSPDEWGYFIFRTLPGTKAPAVQISDVVPKGNTTPSVNVAHQFLVLGLLIAFILVPLVIREVVSTPVGGPELEKKPEKSA